LNLASSSLPSSFWLSRLATLNAALNAARTAARGTAPHKPLMLLTVIAARWKMEDGRWKMEDGDSLKGAPIFSRLGRSGGEGAEWEEPRNEEKSPSLKAPGSASSLR
jgi:hypothetical protein